MEKFPEKLVKKLQSREKKIAKRELGGLMDRIDFSSNDYLGFARKRKIFNEAHKQIQNADKQLNGATGSRLLSGNHSLYNIVEEQLANFHRAEAALIFNSGYDANVGFFSSIPQKGDVVLYDELIHASIRDGIQMCNAKPYKFTHNSLEDLERKLQKFRSQNNDQVDNVEVYVVTESVFSMDGDVPDIMSMIELCESYNAYFVVDEAHATGVYGQRGEGMLQFLGVEQKVFARIHTFGKALGCHGAVILGSYELKSYLVNFSRSFIYTTGLPPHALATIKVAYDELQNTDEIRNLCENIRFFNQELRAKKLEKLFIPSDSAIHCCIIPGNEIVKEIAAVIQNKGFDVKPILSPTVAEGKERLRFCLHSYNTEQEILDVLGVLTAKLF